MSCLARGPHYAHVMVPFFLSAREKGDHYMGADLADLSLSCFREICPTCCPLVRSSLLSHL